MPVIFEVKCYQYLICLKKHIQKYNEFHIMIPQIMGFEGYCFRLVAMTIRIKAIMKLFKIFLLSFHWGGDQRSWIPFKNIQCPFAVVTFWVKHSLLVTVSGWLLLLSVIHNFPSSKQSMKRNICLKWDKLFKNGPIKICGGRPYHVKFFKGYLPQILLSPFLNTLSQIFLVRMS